MALSRSLRIATLTLALTSSIAAVAGDNDDTRLANDGNVILDHVPEIPSRIKARLSRYQNVRAAAFRAWSQDSRSLYITTRFGETRQIHRVDSPGGARRQLTFFSEPIGGVDRQPRGSSLNFTMDEGGSELYQIFLLDPGSGEHRRLTDGASRNGTVAWSPDGTHIAYQSTRRNGRSNDVWVMEVSDPDTARMVFESPDGSWWGPVDWSEDGGRLLVQQYVSVTDSRVHLVDLEPREPCTAGERRGPSGLQRHRLRPAR